MAHQAEIDIGGAGTETSRPPPPRGGEQRLSFRVKVALVWLVIFAVMAFFFAMAKFDWAFMQDNLRFILTGLWVTIVTAVGAIALALVLATLGALGRLSRNSIAYGVSGFYTSFFRGTPLIVQIFLWYLALPEVVSNLFDAGIVPEWLYHLSLLSPLVTGILALGFNYGAYMTEIFRAGILAVGPGQTEAADALGMSYRQRMRRVVLPQAFKIVIPPVGNEFIAMMKDTALISLVGTQLFYWEVFKRAQTIGQQQNRPLEALIVAAGIYWALTAIFSFFQSRLEAKVSRGYVRQPAHDLAGRRRSRWVPTGAAGGGGGVAASDPEEVEAKPSAGDVTERNP
jgi:polar amino acid transport system permease protein